MYNILKGGIFTCPINLLLLVYFLNIIIVLHKIKGVNKMLVAEFRRGLIDRDYPFDMRIIGNTIYVLSLPLVAINTLDLIKDSDISKHDMIDIIYGRGRPSYTQLSFLASRINLSSAEELIDYDNRHNIPHTLNFIDPFNMKLEYLKGCYTPQLMRLEFCYSEDPVYITKCEDCVPKIEYVQHCVYRLMSRNELLRNHFF